MSLDSRPMNLSEDMQKPLWLNAVPAAWRMTFMCLIAACAALMVVTAREWGEMFHQWWNIDTYNHILLVPLIVVWLIWLKLEDLPKLAPRVWSWGLTIVAAGLVLWLVGRFSGINLFAHAGAIGALQGALIALLGLRVCVLLALPLVYLSFLVPFGDEIIPFLQSITAKIAIALTQWSGVPAVIDGIYIDTPAGLFIVAEECSGVKFLIAMVTLAVLVGFTRFQSWQRRALFMVASVIIPILANGVRAWGTIYIAQFAGVEFAAGFDHIFYGWIFFAIVVIIVLAGAWRFFEMEPEDYGYSTQELSENSLITRLEGQGESPLGILAAIVGLALTSAGLSVIFAPMVAG